MNDRPQSLIGMAKIMRLAFEGNNLAELTSELAARIVCDSSDAAAMLDLSIVQQLNAQTEAALAVQWQALQQQQHYRLRSNPSRPSVRVLAVMGPGEVMANTPLEFLIEDSDVALEMLYVGPGLPPVPDIPAHDVAFVAVCESDTNQQLLRQLNEVMNYWPCPHVNRPAQIAQLARDRVSDLLIDLAGVEVVQSRRVARAKLAELSSRSLDFPIIARPANSHAGHGLSKLESAAAVGNYLEQQTADEFSVAPFIDYRTSQDGLYRKYRVALVAGQAYPAHMAVSPRWMVHYLNADMLESAENRAAEAHFMDTFDWEFGARHRSALAAIHERIGLDYYSIDCGETQDGRLLVFEIDSGAVVHTMDPIDLFPYKRPHMLKLFSAVHALLKRTARGKQASPAPTRRRRSAA